MRTTSGKGAAPIHDKSKVVRYRASELLAYLLRRDVLPDLVQAVQMLGGMTGVEDLKAAIDAIETQNHNHFVDRDHSGHLTWTVE